MHLGRYDGMMEWPVKCVVCLFASAVMVCTHSAALDGRSLPQDAQAPASWVDPSTGLMWAGKDNGKDVKWKAAAKYCHDLRLTGHSDWRLATIEELEGISDGDAKAPGLGAGKHGDQPAAWHVKGNLFLTGREWSSTQRMNDQGRPSGFVWYFDFGNNSKDNTDGSRLGDYRRALCVRRPGK
jgi:hypothetical protein